MGGIRYHLFFFFPPTWLSGFLPDVKEFLFFELILNIRLVAGEFSLFMFILCTFVCNRLDLMFAPLQYYIFWSMICILSSDDSVAHFPMSLIVRVFVYSIRNYKIYFFFLSISVCRCLVICSQVLTFIWIYLFIDGYALCFLIVLPLQFDFAHKPLTWQRLDHLFTKDDHDWENDRSLSFLKIAEDFGSYGPRPILGWWIYPIQRNPFWNAANKKPILKHLSSCIMNLK